MTSLLVDTAGGFRVVCQSEVAGGEGEGVGEEKGREERREKERENGMETGWR